MILTRVIYLSGNVICKTSPYMPIEDCRREMERFNNLPILDLERQAMNARIERREIGK